MTHPVRMRSGTAGGAGTRVAVIGGGISGLAAALRLHGDAPDTEITLFESEASLGGKIQTESFEGFIVEGGPDSFLSSKPGGIGLAREIGIEDRLQGVRLDTRRTFVMHDGKLVRLPEGLSGLVPARLGPLFQSPLLSPWGKARVALEYVVPRRHGNADESMGSFIRRRMGSEAYERLVEALLTGIYGGEGDSLSLAATFPRLREIELERGSLLRGLRKPAAPVSGKPISSPFVAPIGGMAEMVAGVAQHLAGVNVCVSTPVRSLARAGERYSVETDAGTIGADAVILATPAFVSADLVSGLNSSLAGSLGDIPYAGTAIVSLAFDLAGPPEGHGYIIPRRENRPIMAVTWSSNKFAHRAPPGTVLSRAFVGRPEHVDLLHAGDTDLVEIARNELQATAGITAEPRFIRVRRWARAMPQYTLGHPERINQIESRLQNFPGLFLAGAAYRGVGIPDCIQSGENAARAAARFIAALQ